LYYTFIIDAFLIACLIEFINFTIQAGNIFDFYKTWLINKFYKGDEPSLLAEDLQEYKEQNITSKWYKVLGGCKYCYQFWITLPIYIYSKKYDLIYFIIFTSLIFVFLRLITYATNR
jgi:hypothetical protein